MRRATLSLSPDAPELDTEAVKEAYQEFPVKETVTDRDAEIRKLRDALVESTILLTVGASEPATDKAIRLKMSNQINENMKLI